MVSLQEIARVAIMLKQQHVPVPLCMATRAGVPKASLVAIIFLVTTDAIDRGLFLVQKALMTGFAACSLVPPEQGVFCVKVMVKDDGLPVPFCMAGLALLSIAPFMRIVFLVAGVAFEGGVLKGRGRMAFGTLHRLMLAD